MIDQSGLEAGSHNLKRPDRPKSRDGAQEGSPEANKVLAGPEALSKR